MTPAPRYDQRWQIEHRIADLVGEQKILQFQIRRLSEQHDQLDEEIKLLQTELFEGEPS